MTDPKKKTRIGAKAKKAVKAVGGAIKHAAQAVSSVGQKVKNKLAGN